MQKVNSFFMHNTRNAVFAVYIFGVAALIIVQHFGMLSIPTSIFSVLVIVAVSGAMIAPRAAFAVFVGLLPLETISLAPVTLSLALRPYQILGAALAVSVLYHLVLRRKKLRLPRWRIVDGLVLVFGFIGFVSMSFAPDVALSLKQALVVTSFVLLYFVTRVFVQNPKDLHRPTIFFLSSAALVLLYGVLQNWLFAHGLTHNEIMPGRPNATFAEADWFGLFAVFVVAVGYSVLFALWNTRNMWRKPATLAIFVLLVLSMMATIMSVARSAWLAGLGMSVLFVILIWWQKGFAKAIHGAAVVTSALLVAYILIIALHLTSFELSGRAASTAGLQEITIACDSTLRPPQKIATMEELAQYNCRHIDLEDVSEEQVRGTHVTTVLRPDPNVHIRKETFARSWRAVRVHPLIGSGWGSSGIFLGTDAAGTKLNASNVFLEVWLSTGLIGLSLLIAIIGLILTAAWRAFTLRNTREASLCGLVVFLGIVAIGVSNLFNAGLLMGFIWVFLGITGIVEECKKGDLCR